MSTLFMHCGANNLNDFNGFKVFPCALRPVPFARITSYNVCYTKLLRPLVLPLL